MLQSIVKDDVNFTIKMRTFIGFISVLFFVSCQTSEKPKYSKTTKEIPSQIKNQLQEHPGKKLWRTIVMFAIAQAIVMIIELHHQ